MAKKGKDGLTAAQRKDLLRYNRLGIVLAVAVLAIFMVVYQMTGYARGSEPGPEVYRSGTATVSGCARQPITLFTMYLCQGDDVTWTTMGPDSPGTQVILDETTDGGVPVWAHQPVSGQVSIEAHATQQHRATTDVYKDHEIYMPVGQYHQAGSTFFLWYLAAMAASALAAVWAVDRLGRRRILAKG